MLSIKHQTITKNSHDKIIYAVSIPGMWQRTVKYNACMQHDVIFLNFLSITLVQILNEYDHDNTLRPRQHGRNLADDNFKNVFFLCEKVLCFDLISLSFVRKSFR